MEWLWVIMLWFFVGSYALVLSLVVLGAAYQITKFMISRDLARFLWAVHATAFFLLATSTYVLILEVEDLQNILLWPFFVFCVLVCLLIYSAKTSSLGNTRS